MAEPQSQGLQSSRFESTHTGPQRVFVYGTLKSGFGNHDHYLKDRHFIGNGRVEGLMFHLGAIPAVNLSEAFTTIIGEVYEVSWEDILALDQLEGVDSRFYDRIEAKIGPQGKAWMYIMPNERAGTQQWVVPSGIWRGPETPKVRWNGFGKGVAVGTFEAHPTISEIKIGNGEGPWVLKRSLADNTFKLIDKRTGEVIGSYHWLRDMVGSDGRTKPVLRLPATTKPTVAAAVQEQLQLDGSVVAVATVQHNPNLPLVWAPQPTKNEAKEEEEVSEPVPQAARLLGYKYGEA